MTRLQYASDLHLEFAENASYIKHNPLKVAGDILVLAGDIGYFGDENDSRHPFWDWASDNYKQVLFQEIMSFTKCSILTLYITVGHQEYGLMSFVIIMLLFLCPNILK